MESTFPPEGWQTSVKDGRTQYLCNPPQCQSTELVLVDDLPIAGLSEKLIRSGAVKSDTIAKLDRYVAKARKGTYQAEPAIPVISEDYSGFRHKATLNEDGNVVFLEGQSIVQGSGGIIVLSFAHDQTIAEQNLNTYLSNTTIKRPQ
ncbi:hypothetical protein [Roseibium sp.]|uniref:hypothetical protein n=1 Tax=Roseibium sp. TaxID=1936156 RepID=UPI003BABA3DE